MKLDIGCGKNKRAGFIGVDQYPMDGVDIVFDVADPVDSITDPLMRRVARLVGCEYKRWPWEDNSVDEVNCSHFLEHLSAPQRCHFLNELWRVMKPGAKATITTPYWRSSRAYGDPTHQWPPVGEMFEYYLSRDWRASQAPHTDVKWNSDGLNCNFESTWGYIMKQELLTRTQEFQQFALTYFCEAAQDMIATLTKRG